MECWEVILQEEKWEHFGKYSAVPDKVEQELPSISYDPTMVHPGKLLQESLALYIKRYLKECCIEQQFSILAEN